MLNMNNLDRLKNNVDHLYSIGRAMNNPLDNPDLYSPDKLLQMYKDTIDDICQLAETLKQATPEK